MGVGPTSLSSIAPGWKGGKLPPLGGSLGEYSLNDFDEQPAEKGPPNRWPDTSARVFASPLASMLAGASGGFKLRLRVSVCRSVLRFIPGQGGGC